MKLHLKAILSSYAEVFFLPGIQLGVALLAITLLDPRVGVEGLASVLTAYGLARVVGMDQVFLKQSYHIYNPLLVGLSVGHWFAFSWPTLLLVAAAGGFTFIMTACLANVFANSLRLPVLSVPFVVVSSAVYLASLRYSNLMVNGYHGPASLAGDFGLPFWAAGFFKSLGAVLFSPTVVIGMLISLLIVCHSRILFLLAILGYAVGVSVRALMFGSALQACGDLNSFNFILIAMAVGGVFLIPSLKSYFIAAVAVMVSTVFMDAQTGFWSFHGVPVLTLPFNVMTLGVVYLLGVISHPLLVTQPGRTPEETLEVALANRWRYAGRDCTLYLPFAGRWTVWQGFDGKWTHQGVWRHAYDFVIEDDEGKTHTGDGDRLEDYYAFRKPVLSPVRGRVVRIVDSLPDKALGQADEANKWGNVVIVRDERGFCVELSHFAEKSLQVKVGDWVERGAVLGLCGNSGYSPQPHIHVQAQMSESIGGATIPFSFVNFVDGGFHANDLPQEKSRVEALYPSKRIENIMNFALDDTLEYRITRKGVAIDTLKLTVRMAQDGTFYFESAKGVLYFGKHEGTFYIYRLVGDDPWLRLIFLGLPRLPPACRDRMEWSECVPVYLVAGGFASGLIGLLSSFYPSLARAPVQQSFEGENVVNTVATSRIPGIRKQVRVELDHGKGIRMLSMGDIRMERVDQDMEKKRI